MTNQLTISLHGMPAPPSTPSLSGYCQKLETFFRLVSFTQYTLVPTHFHSSPTGKLPFVTLHHPAADASPEVIADSHFIIRSLISRGLVPDPDAKLTKAQRADSRAHCVWVEQHIYPVVVHQRWSRAHNFAKNVELIPVPWFVKPLLGWYLRRSILAALWTAGVGRYSDSEIDEEVTEWVDGLEAKLTDGREWLMGVDVDPGLVDATVWGFLINFLGTGEGNREVVKLIKERKGVCMYIRRGAAKWFPEYDIEKMLGTIHGPGLVY